MIPTVSKIQLSQYTLPVSKEIGLVENILQNLVHSLAIDGSKSNTLDSYKLPDRNLYAALILLTYKSLKTEPDDVVNSQLVQLASIMEFIHYAIFIHNEIMDDELGQTKYDFNTKNRISVLIGDILYTQAFFSASLSLPGHLSQVISNLTQNMCLAEIKEEMYNDAQFSLEKYLEIAREKTAVFFGACSRIASSLATSDENIIKEFEKFGLNLGMIFQYKLDSSFKHKATPEFLDSNILNSFISEAKTSIDFLGDSVYKENLLELVNYISNF